MVIGVVGNIGVSVNIILNLNNDHVTILHKMVVFLVMDWMLKLNIVVT